MFTFGDVLRREFVDTRSGFPRVDIISPMPSIPLLDIIHALASIPRFARLLGGGLRCIY